MNIFSNLLSFKGEITRKTYWHTTVSLALGIFTLTTAGLTAYSFGYHTISDLIKGTIVIYIIFSVVVLLSLQVRRCRNAGLSIFFVLLSFVPIAQWFWLIAIGIVQKTHIESINRSLHKIKTEIKTPPIKQQIPEKHDMKPNHSRTTQSLIDQYGEYKSLTKKNDWAGICRLNNIDFHSSKWGTRKEINRLPEQLQADEVVFCFTSGIISKNKDSNSSDFGLNTWLIVLTDRRFLFLDAAMLTSALDVHSILHKNIQSVRISQGFFLGKVCIDTGGRSTILDNCEKHTVKVLGILANEWLQVLEERKFSPPHVATFHAENNLEKLKQLGELKSLGLVTEQEFNEAKAKVLATTFKV